MAVGVETPPETILRIVWMITSWNNIEYERLLDLIMTKLQGDDEHFVNTSKFKFRIQLQELSPNFYKLNYEYLLLPKFSRK